MGKARPNKRRLHGIKGPLCGAVRHRQLLYNVLSERISSSLQPSAPLSPPSLLGGYPLTGRWNKCRGRTGRYRIPSDELCGDEDDCHLSAYKGHWIYCKCRFGYRQGEVNRISICVAGRCSHVICWGCLARTKENIGAMYAEDGSENSAEMDKATNEDTSEDSMIFSDSIDDN